MSENGIRLQLKGSEFKTDVVQFSSGKKQQRKKTKKKLLQCVAHTGSRKTRAHR